MIFNNYFILINYIISNYDNINYDIIFCKNDIITNKYELDDDYIKWHVKNIGTDITNNKLISGIITCNNIKSKSKKYYMNIIINYIPEYLENAFYDIFFNKIKIAIIITNYIQNYINFESLNNYKIDLYLCIYDIEDPKYRIPINKDDIQQKIKNIKKLIIKDSQKCIKIFDDINMNELYYRTSNIYEAYHSIKENYFFYISLESNLIIENINEIINNNYNELINNKIVMHDNFDETITEKFIICNIFSAEIIFNFHIDIYKYIEVSDRAFYFFLINKKIDYVKENIYTIQPYKQKFIGTSKKNILHLQKIKSNR